MVAFSEFTEENIATKLADVYPNVLHEGEQSERKRLMMPFYIDGTDFVC